MPNDKRFNSLGRYSKSKYVKYKCKAKIVRQLEGKYDKPQSEGYILRHFSCQRLNRKKFSKYERFGQWMNKLNKNMSVFYPTIKECIYFSSRYKMFSKIDTYSAKKKSYFREQ